MRKNRLLLGAAALVGAVSAGAVTASVLQDAPRDARPVQADPIGDILKKTQAQPPVAVPTESAPAGAPAPKSPVAVTPPPAVVIAEDEAVEKVADEAIAAPVEKAIEQPATPARRQRRKFAVIQAIDKTTTESMKFEVEVEVGGRPVRFNQNLIFNVRACEVTTPDELTEDSIAYVDVSMQPRGSGQNAEARQIFRGWMFSSSPAVSGLQHPNYDAWVVGCKN